MLTWLAACEDCDALKLCNTEAEARHWASVHQEEDDHVIALYTCMYHTEV